MLLGNFKFGLATKLTTFIRDPIIKYTCPRFFFKLAVDLKYPREQVGAISLPCWLCQGCIQKLRTVLVAQISAGPFSHTLSNFCFKEWLSCSCSLFCWANRLYSFCTAVQPLSPMGSHLSTTRSNSWVSGPLKLVTPFCLPPRSLGGGFSLPVP